MSPTLRELAPRQCVPLSPKVCEEKERLVEAILAGLVKAVKPKSGEKKKRKRAGFTSVYERDGVEL